MKTWAVVFIVGLIFVFSPACDWVVLNTPEWVSALIAIVGLPWASYKMFKMLYKFAQEASKDW